MQSSDWIALIALIVSVVYGIFNYRHTNKTYNESQKIDKALLKHDIKASLVDCREILEKTDDTLKNMLNLIANTKNSTDREWQMFLKLYEEQCQIEMSNTVGYLEKIDDEITRLDINNNIKTEKMFDTKTEVYALNKELTSRNKRLQEYLESAKKRWRKVPPDYIP